MPDNAGRDMAPVPPERRAQTVRRIIGFFRPYRVAVSAVLVTIVITSLLGLVNPYLLKLLIDVAIPQRDFALLTLYVALMMVLAFVPGILAYVYLEKPMLDYFQRKIEGDRRKPAVPMAATPPP